MVGRMVSVLFNREVYQGKIVSRDGSKYQVSFTDRQSGRKYKIWYKREALARRENYEHEDIEVGSLFQWDGGNAELLCAGIVEKIVEKDGIAYAKMLISTKDESSIDIRRILVRKSIKLSSLAESGNYYRTNPTGNSISLFINTDNTIKPKRVSFLSRECSDCNKFLTINEFSRQFIFPKIPNIGNGEFEERTLCRNCDIPTDCDSCCNDTSLYESNHFYHDVKSTEIMYRYGTLCMECMDNVNLCCRCGFVEDEVIEINNARFCGNCSEEEIQEFYNVPHRAIRPIHHKLSSKFSKNKSHRSVGLEIECIHNWRETRVPDDWKIVGDTSISDEELGAEYVLQYPRNGDLLLNGIKEVTDTISETDGVVDNSCGLHIHINALDMQLKEMKNCLALGKTMERWIYDMLPAGRKYNRYSKALPTFNMEDMMEISTLRDFSKMWYYGISGTEITNHKYNESRYRGFNLHSRIVNGTIEFRHHHGTLKYLNIEKWINLCLAIVENSFDLSKNLEDIIFGRNESSAEEFFYFLGINNFTEHYNNQKRKFRSEGAPIDPIIENTGYSSDEDIEDTPFIPSPFDS